MISKEIINLYLPTIKRHKNLFDLMIIGAVISGFASLATPLLLKYETDQLAKTWSSIFPQISDSPFFVFVVILLVLLVVKFIDEVLEWILKIIIYKKEEMMENELQIDLFTHMQEVEVGRTLNSRFHYLRENIESAFSNLWKKFLHGPKDILTTLISSIGITAVFAYFDIRLLMVIVVTALIQHTIDSLYERQPDKHELFNTWLTRYCNN